MPTSVTLEGRYVRLEPLTLGHVPALAKIGAGPRESFAFTLVPADEPATRAYVEAALREQRDGRALPFATVERATGHVVGSTRFGNVEFWAWPAGNPNQRGADLPDVVEIGWTWLAPDVRRSGINTEAKLLMLTHAFETWRVHRVSLVTDARNARSREAILRLGARFDGVLRAARIGADGAVRDSACYSIRDAEWPEVKRGLAARLR
ncbi:MAG TPA: GNAT family protein [Methylomirabilota bacterium]|nr:GNAT family protein [Methylomirabilota bacterium]